jgi:hypothetical protein
VESDIALINPLSGGANSVESCGGGIMKFKLLFKFIDLLTTILEAYRELSNAIDKNSNEIPDVDRNKTIKNGFNNFLNPRLIKYFTDNGIV